MEKQAVSLVEQMNKLSAALDYCDGLTKESPPQDVEAIFGEIYQTHCYDAEGDRKIATYECGSFPLETALSLYRVLFLARPKQLSFRRMYKECLFALVSPNGEFVANIELFKYELAVYVSATKEHIQGRQSGVISGMPGADNGLRAKSPELIQWAALLKRCLERKWMVYGGNDFEV